MKVSSIDWRRILVEELSEKPRYEPDWKRPSRRTMAVSTRIARQRGWPVVIPLYHPSRYKCVYEKPRIAIVFDISGAINKDFYKMHIEDLNDCIKHVEPEGLWILHCDYEVRYEEYCRQPGVMRIDLPKEIPSSKGPSAYTSIFKYIKEHKCEKPVRSIVYLTDLRPTEPWNALDRELLTLFHQIRAKKLLWLVPSDVTKGNFWKPCIGKIIWI
ncbi:MAG: hypothetical protein DRJ69_05175 [Thermoprotei archaeon]|nr:MAG: hypothetical protein DRJ69_05175 [Thermoprotei archaeon]